MRLLYVTVVVSLVSMILIGSYLCTPTRLKAAVIRPAMENAREIREGLKKNDTLFDWFKKYKTDMERLLQAKKT